MKRTINQEKGNNISYQILQKWVQSKTWSSVH